MALDPIGRLDEVEHKPSTAGAAFARFGYGYDKAGNRTRQSDYDSSRSPSGTDQYFEYDALHRLVRETPRAGVAGPNAWGYDAAGNRTDQALGQALVEDAPSASVRYSGAWSGTADGQATNGGYRKADQAGVSVDVDFSGTALSLVYTALADGGRLRATLDPGTGNARELGEVDQCAPATEHQRQQTWTGLPDGAHTVRFTALAGSCNGSTATRATLDAVRPYARQKAYRHDPNNRLTRVTVAGSSDISLEYDQNGSATKKTQGTDVTTYAWDGARRLKEVKQNGSTQASFAYDGNGARTSKTAGGATTTYVNDSRSLTEVLQETKGTNTLSYVPGVGQNDPSKAGDAKWAYFHADAKDNRVLTDRAGLVSKRWEYDPFGQIRTQSGTATSDFGYADEQRDAETGLVNLRARYYDPALGRFLSRDSLSGTPTAPQSFNRYAYVVNNPLRYVDPSGHDYPGEDDDDDREARDCANPGRYTGSCPGGPPNPQYAAEGERDAELKELGKALQAQGHSPEAQAALLAASNTTPQIERIQPAACGGVKCSPLQVTWEEYVARLFAIAFPDEAYQFFDENGSFVSDAAYVIAIFSNPPGTRSWYAMPEALANLAAHYAADQVGDFVRDVGTLFAGLYTRLETGIAAALTGGRRNFLHPQVHTLAALGEAGLKGEFRDGDPDANVHHWAWSFVLGYAAGEREARAINAGRERGTVGLRQDRVNHADIRIGNVGAQMGGALADGRASPSDVPRMMRELMGIPRLE